MFARVFSLFLLLAVLAMATLSGQGMRTPLQAWLFDDGSGTTVNPWVGDESGSFQYGNATSGSPTPVTGTPGSLGPNWWSASGGASNVPTSLQFNYAGSDAVYFDQNDAYIDFAGLANTLNGSQEVTFQFWIYSTANSVNDGAFFTGRSNAEGGSDSWGSRHDVDGLFGGDDDVFKFSLGINDNEDVDEFQAESSDGTALVQTWQHVIMSWEDGVDLRVWIDGVEETFPSFNDFPTDGVISNQEVFWLGTGPKQYWLGVMDDIAVWQVALTPEEVAKVNNNALIAFNFWDNEKSGDSTWQAGLDVNWLGDQNPLANTDVFFGIDPPAPVAQNVQLVGDQTVRSINFDAPFAYRLYDETIILEEDMSKGYSTVAEGISINMTDRNSEAGDPSPDHTIDSDLELRGDLEILNTTAGSLVINGDMSEDATARDLSKTGSGRLVLAGDNTFSGDVTVTAGTLEVQSDTGLGDGGGISNTTVQDGATLAVSGNINVDADETYALTGQGVGNEGALVNESGFNVLQGAVSLVGDTTINSKSGDLLLTGVISDTGGLTKTGSGEVTLGGANTFTGGVTVQEGVLAITNSSALGDLSQTTTVEDGATLELESGGLTVANQISLAGQGNGSQAALNLSSGTSSVSGDITLADDASVGASGSSTLTLSGVISDGGSAYDLNKEGTGTVVLSGTNTYTGDTTVEAGTLQLSGGNAIVDSNLVTVDSGATLDLNGSSETIGQLTGSGNVELSSGSSGTLTIDDNTLAGSTFDGVISDGGAAAGNLILDGSSTVTLTGANTFTGTTIVNGGTLQLTGGDNRLSTSSSLVLNNGTLALGSINQTVLDLDINTSATIDFGSNVATLTATSISDLGSETITVDNWIGNPLGGGSSQWLTSTDLSAGGGPTFLSNINFTEWGVGALQLPSGEIVPDIANKFTWIDPATSEWRNTGGDATPNWITETGTNGTPNNRAHTAIFADVAPLDNTATIFADRRMRALIFDTDNDLLINADQTSDELIFQAPSGVDFTHMILEGTGAQEVDARIRVEDTLIITNNSTAALGLDIDGRIQLRGDNDLKVTGAGTTQIDGRIREHSSASNLEKAGTGTLILNNNSNDYAGTTTLEGGTLSLGASNALGAASSDVIIGTSSTPSTADLTLVLNMDGVTLNRDLDVNDFGNNVTLGGNHASGTNTFSGDINLDRDVILSSENAGAVTEFSGAFANTDAGLTKEGAGTVLLTGQNLNNGDLIINEGILQVNQTSGNGALDDVVDVSLANTAGATFELLADETISSLAGGGSTGGNVDLNGNRLTLGTASEAQTDTEFAGSITGTGGITKREDGTFTLSGDSDYSGETILNEGTIVVASDNALGDSVSQTTTDVADGAVLALDGSGGDLTVDNERLEIGGTGIGGAGALQNLAGDNTWSGPVDFTGDPTINVAADSLTLSGTVSGSSSEDLTKNGTGDLILSGGNTFQGALTINEGVVRAQSSSALGNTGTGTTVNSGGSLVIDGYGLSLGESVTLNGTGTGSEAALQNEGGNNTLTGSVTLGDNATVGAEAGTRLTLDGVVSDGANDFDFTKVGDGTVVLSATNTYSGDTIVRAGTLETAQNNAISNSSVLQVDSGATFDLNNNTETVANLRGGGTIDLGSGELTFGADDNATLVQGNVTGSGDLVKEGFGVTTFQGTSDFTGDLTLEEGTIILDNSSGEAISQASSVIVRDGGTLLLSEDNQLGDAVDLVLGGGASSDPATFSVSGVTDTLGTLTLNEDAILNMPNTGGSITFGDFAPSSNDIIIENWD